ncbi:WSC domain-containing protein [Colletotrichum higginsianum]|nr:WSC domain-containing protein [Colletotrichum higginsianum]
MRLPSLLGPSSRRSQTVISICLIVLTLFTAFAVSQALPRIQDESDAGNLARRDANIEARQLQGAPWGLPWGIFGGGQSASSVQPAQPAITTPLPAAVTVVGNNQPQGPLGVIGQILPTIVAPLTAAVGGVAAPVASVVPLGNVLPSVVNAVPSLLQPGGLSGLPSAVPNAVPNAQGGQPPANGGLVPAVQSLVSIVLGAGGNAGSLVPLSGITGVLNPLTSPAGGVLPVSQVTAVVGNGAPVINMPSQLPAMSIINNIPTIVSGLPSAIGLITALPANLPSILPTVIPNLPINPVVTNLNEVLGPVSVLLPLSSVLPVDTSGLNAPQLPEDLTGAVPSILSSLAIVINQPAPPASAVGDVDSQATTPWTRLVLFPVPCLPNWRFSCSSSDRRVVCLLPGRYFTAVLAGQLSRLSCVYQGTRTFTAAPGWQQWHGQPPCIFSSHPLHHAGKYASWDSTALVCCYISYRQC